VTITKSDAKLSDIYEQWAM